MNFKKWAKAMMEEEEEEEIPEKSLARQINDNLDEILSIREESKKLNSIISENSEAKITNVKTGEKASLKEALSVAEEMIDRIKNNLNQITNNGKNVIDIFTNKYYINDILQDKECAKDSSD